jgi:hypothetical protein
VGEDTGLGLYISPRIVDRDGRDTSIETRQGDTVLRVRIPTTVADAAPRHLVRTTG